MRKLDRVEIARAVTNTAPTQLPDAAALSVLRAWHEGLPSRDSVDRYISQARGAGASARGVIGAIRRQVAAVAMARHRMDLARHFAGPARKGAAAAPCRGGRHRGAATHAHP